MIFLISMPLSAKICVFVVPGRQKSTKNRTTFKKKNDSQKTRSRAALFREKKRFLTEKCSKTGPGTGGNEPRFSSLFRPWTPEGAPGAPKSAPGSPKGATGRDFLRFVAVFGWSRTLFFDYFL